MESYMHTACKTNFAAISALTGAVEKESIWAKVRSEMLNNSLARKLTVGFGTLSALAMSQAAVAFAAPSTGSFAYNIYDIAINKVANGPIGFVGGGWLIAMAATKMNEGWVRALPYAIGGSCLIKIEELTSSLGAILN